MFLYHYQSKLILNRLNAYIVFGQLTKQQLIYKFKSKNNSYRVQNNMPKKLLGQKIKTFNLINKLGQGSFAVVFQGIDESNNNSVAVKVMKMSELNNRTKLNQLVKTEIAVLKSCKNSNVIKYVDSFQTNQFLFIVTQFCNGGDLQQHLQKHGKLTEDEAVTYLKQILNGFKGLHEVGAMHRDFKVANVLLHDKVCKIADLGFAKQMEQTAIAKTILGTSLTMAPEVLGYLPYGFEADIWSIGVVFYQLLYGKYPYNGKSDSDLLSKIKQGKPNYQQVNISKDTKDFIKRCLTVNPKERISWKQIYQHPLLADSLNGKMITSGGLKSQISINGNKNFYQTTNLNKNKDQNQNLLKTIAKELVVQVIQDQNVKEVKNIENLQNEAEKIKQNQKIFHKFQEFYISKRNDIMFVNKFIQPYVNNFKNVRINHSTALFIFSKKSYIDLKGLYQSMQNKKNIYSNNFQFQKGFEQFSKSQNYTKLTAQIQKDMNTMLRSCEEHKSTIKISSLDIQNEFDLEKGESGKLDHLIKQLSGEYIRILTQSLDLEKGQERMDMIKLIQALVYYKSSPRPYSHQFDRIISTTNLVEAQKSLRNKYK